LAFIELGLMLATKCLAPKDVAQRRESFFFLDLDIYFLDSLNFWTLLFFGHFGHLKRNKKKLKIEE
jgi:hypothetical protein